MSRLRHSTSTLAVLALLVAVPALVTTPIGAQEDDTPTPPVKFFVFVNGMTNPDADNDGEPDRRWQVQITVSALGSCVPTQGDAGYTSTWIEAGDEVGARLSLTECVFRISAKARTASRPDCLSRAQLGWSDSGGNVVGDYRDGSVVTSSRPDDESRLLIRRDPDGGCAVPHRTYFVLGGDSIVEDLPGDSADRDLLARARRAATVGEFTVRVQPASGSVAAGCDITRTFSLQGDRSTSAQILGATGDGCPSRASIVAAPAHVKVTEGSYVEFDAALPNIIIDLTSLVRMEAARIAIVQDVVGSANRGEVSYTITRTCGGVALDSPPAQARASELYEGRFTVHSPDIPQFGPVGIYPAVATGATSFTVVGCLVTVTMSGVPAGCAVAGGNTQTLAWSAANPFPHFDFEFDINCGGATPPAPVVPQQPPATEDTVPAEDMVPVDEADTLVDGGGTTGGDTGEAQDAQPPDDPVGPPRDAPTG